MTAVISTKWAANWAAWDFDSAAMSAYRAARTDVSRSNCCRSAAIIGSEGAAVDSRRSAAVRVADDCEFGIVSR